MRTSKIHPHIFPRIPKLPLSSPLLLFRTPPVRRNTTAYAAVAVATSSPPPPPPTSVYVHLPFCRKRCHYCDFPVIALGSVSAPIPDPRFSNYVALLLREIQATKPKSAADPPLKTVFFGGGTPSLVPPPLIHSLLNALSGTFGVAADAEVSMEMDPGTFDSTALRELVGMGVNRVSLGVQAFQEEMLGVCGRSHGVGEVVEAVRVVKGESGLVNWSMDLISSLPGQKVEMWEESLRRGIEAAPAHFSVYDLQIEQGTKFGKLYTPGEFPLPSEKQSANFYKMAVEMLSGEGYEHYEISNYSKSGFQCKHNLTYWKNEPYYAFGLGAASYVNHTRFSRPRRMRDYANYVNDLENGVFDHALNSNVNMDAKDMAMDTVMLSLRTARGLDVRSFIKNFGLPLTTSLCKTFEPYFESGHVVALDDGRRPISPSVFKLQTDCDFSTNLAFLRLSDPEGFLLSNELISTAFRTISP